MVAQYLKLIVVDCVICAVFFASKNLMTVGQMATNTGIGVSLNAYFGVSPTDEPAAPGGNAVPCQYLIKGMFELLHVYFPLLVTTDILVRESIDSHKDGSSSHDAKTTLQHCLVVLCSIREGLVSRKRIEYIAGGVPHCEEKMEAMLSLLASAARHYPTATNATLDDNLFVSVSIRTGNFLGRLLTMDMSNSMQLVLKCKFDSDLTLFNNLECNIAGAAVAARARASTHHRTLKRKLFRCVFRHENTVFF